MVEITAKINQITRIAVDPISLYSKANTAVTNEVAYFNVLKKNGVQKYYPLS